MRMQFFLQPFTSIYLLPPPFDRRKNRKEKEQEKKDGKRERKKKNLNMTIFFVFLFRFLLTYNGRRSDPERVLLLPRLFLSIYLLIRTSK